MGEADSNTTLYFSPGSSSLAPHAALIESGATFDAVPVLLSEGEQKLPKYLAVNRSGRIPALTVNGCLITEVVGILTWIACRYPSAGLLPFADPLLMGRAYSMMSYYASTLAVAIAQRFRTERFTPDESLWPALRRDAQTAFETGLGQLERDMRGEWILGDRYCVVDAYAFVVWRWRERLGLDAAAYPALRAHADRVHARPAVRKVLEIEAELEAARLQRAAQSA